jgi:hypothetical protein
VERHDQVGQPVRVLGAEPGGEVIRTADVALFIAVDEVLGVCADQVDQGIAGQRDVGAASLPATGLADVLLGNAERGQAPVQVGQPWMPAPGAGRGSGRSRGLTADAGQRFLPGARVVEAA